MVTNPGTVAPIDGAPREAPRILFYSHDGFGLGHLRRNLKLAERLVADWPGASALLVAGLPGTPGIDLPAGIDLVKLPSIRKIATDAWEARQLRVEASRLREMRRRVLEGAFAGFEPHLVVVDYLPLGVWGELFAPLSQLRHRHPESAIALGLRDVLDAPLVTRKSWREGQHDHAVRSLYDVVHVYGDPDVYDTAMVYGLDQLAPDRVFYTGYVCPEPHAFDVVEERRRFDLQPGEELVVVTAGGGADAFPMMRAAVEASRLLAARGRRLRTLVVTGPLMPPAEVETLERLATGEAITVRRWRSGLEATMAASDAVVTMAAYNTLTEAVRLGCRVVSVPRPGPSAEQTTRAKLFAERGLVHALPPDASPELLARTLGALLGRGPSVRAHPPAMDGLENATGRLLSLLARALAPAPAVAHGGGRLA